MKTENTYYLKVSRASNYSDLQNETISSEHFWVSIKHATYNLNIPFWLFSRILATYCAQNINPEEQTTTRKTPWSTDTDCEGGRLGPSYPTPDEIFICVPECSSDGHRRTNHPSESRLLWFSSLLVSGPVPDSSCHRWFRILQVTLI